MRKKTQRKDSIREAVEERLLAKLEGRWVKVAGSDGVYLLHRRNPSNRCIEQIVLSGNLSMDGVYELKDYRLEEVFDQLGNRILIKICVKNCDQRLGRSIDPGLSEQKLAELLQEYGVTEEEFRRYFYERHYSAKMTEEILLDA